jgi:hypothetical protein
VINFRFVHFLSFWTQKEEKTSKAGFYVNAGKSG